MLTLRGVVVDFDGFKAVGGVDLTIEQGELRFLIGPNGAGKTSLIDVITGLTKPSEGEITFDGQSMAGVSAAKRVRLGIGRSFQTPTVFDSLTVVENLDLAETYRFPLRRMLRRRRGSATGSSPRSSGSACRPRRTARPACSATGRSSGSRSGCCSCNNRSCVLLDEPVAGMSGSERQATGELLEELAEDHTVVVIEHDMAFLRRFARSVTVLHEGKILSEGSVDHVQGDPKVREVYLGRSRDERSGAVAEETADVSTASVSELGAERSEVGAMRLQVEDLDVAYGRTQVVFGVSLDVPSGSLTCLMGRNGVGKTTLLNTVMGLLPARRGRDPPRRRGHHQGDHLQAGPQGASATCPRATRSSRA